MFYFESFEIFFLIAYLTYFLDILFKFKKKIVKCFFCSKKNKIMVLIWRENFYYKKKFSLTV